MITGLATQTTPQAPRLDWTTLLLGNELLTWGVALGVAAATWMALNLAKRAVGVRLRRLARRTENEVDDTISGLLERTSGLALFVLALVVGSRALTLPPTVDGVVAKVAALVLLIQGTLWASYLFQDLIVRAIRRRESKGLIPRSVTTLIKVAGRLVIWSIALLVAIETAGYDATALVTGLGIGGIAVGLALQGILKDLFSFLAIVLDRPFAVGDTIAVGDLLGTVERVGIKTTRLRALSGEELVFGNSDLLSSRVRNFHDVQQRRIAITFGVTYETTPDHLEAIPVWVEEAVSEVEKANFQRCFLTGLAESSIHYELVLTVLTSDYNEYLATQQSAVVSVLRRFEREGIDLAYPTRTLHLTPSDDEPRKHSEPESG